MTWNPRYVAYAAAHGHDPNAMLAHDEAHWPGGKMCGFMLWINNRPRRRNGTDDYLSDQDHNDFTMWCPTRAEK